MSMTFLSVTLLALLAVGAAGDPQKQILRPEGAAPRFPYSPGIIAGDLVFVAGQGSRDSKTGQHPATFEDQVRHSIERVRTVLKAGGMDLANAISCHVYLDDMENYGRMNAVYGKLFTETPPVRTTIAVPALPDESHIEVTCVAARDNTAKKALYRGGQTPAKPGLFPGGNRLGDWVFTSGAGSRDPATGKHPEGFPAQVRQVMENLGAVIKPAGFDFADVVWANVYLDNIANLAEFDKVYNDYFRGKRKPARAVSIVAKIPGDSRVEVTLLAAGASLQPRSIKGGAGVLAGNTLFLSTHSAPGATIEDQVHGAFKKLKKSLEAAKMSLADVVKSHVYLKNIADFPRMNAVYRTYFAADPPARTTVQLKQPGSAPDAMVEIAFVAVK